MQQKTIYTIGIDLPGDEFEYIPFHAQRSLLGADLVLYCPTLDLEVAATGEDAAFLSQSAMARNQRYIAHWRSELQGVLAAGKPVFALLAAPQKVGASAAGTAVCSYDALPLAFRSLSPAAGKTMTVAPAGTMLAAWWRLCAAQLHYAVTFEVEGGTTLLTDSGARTVGAAVAVGRGTLLLLPHLELASDEFVYCDPARREFFWTDAALRYGVELVESLTAIAATLASRAAEKGRSQLQLSHESLAQAAPDWVAEECYRLQSEVQALEEIEAARSRIEALQAQVAVLEEQISERQRCLPEACRFKRLLYASGPDLQLAVSEALQLLGFVPQPGAGFNFTSGGVRLLAEVTESVDSAVDLDQVLRLEQAVQADFSQDGVESYARGVLFANPYGTTPPSARGRCFTDKALAAAKRLGFILLPTAELFGVIQYLAGTADQAFAEQVRNAILASNGEPVRLPAVPKSALGRV